MRIPEAEALRKQADELIDRSLRFKDRLRDPRTNVEGQSILNRASFLLRRKANKLIAKAEKIEAEARAKNKKPEVPVPISDSPSKKKEEPVVKFNFGPINKHLSAHKGKYALAGGVLAAGLGALALRRYLKKRAEKNKKK